ncbi:protein translocase subunit SecDF [Halalkalibacterium ligniniphilum]|uniref:protein translocase subunit SecDF n=1 Tax=Halalkalibacterium ligniniphilum TaxID=1134413 RepID=UPI0003457F50|nr:protein translocase subunit SecDF [Halalkalibacterium ligniniphilum]
MKKRGRIATFFIITLLIGVLIGLNGTKVAQTIPLGLDLQGGFEILYEVEPAEEGQKITNKVLESTVSALENRINVLGVSEPNIVVEGENRIRVQLAGISDQTQARELLSTQAELTFRNIHDEVLLTGADLKENGASMTLSQTNQPWVALTLKDAKKFGAITEELSKKAYPENLLVIWLDYEEGDSYAEEAQKAEPKFLSAATVRQKLNTTDVVIEGQFTMKEAQHLADLLNSGSLPVKMHEIYSTSVGAKFGQQALDQTMFAGVIGILAIFLFMLIFYRLPGFVAIITLAAYIYLILQIFSWMHGVLTLPGIAALILGVGMGVDANIITYERIKEELKLGKSLRSAFRSGNKNSFATIFDANLTTIIAGVVLFIFGTSAVKGFATMLIVSILVSFITAVFLARLLLGLLVKSRWFEHRPWYFGVKKEDILEINNTDKQTDAPTRFDNVDFVKNRNKFFLFSAVTVLAGIIILLTMQLNLGIDFASGTRVEITSENPLTLEQVEADLAALDLETHDLVLSGTNNEMAVARFVGVLDREKIAEFKHYFAEKYGFEPNVSTVSPIVGKELAQNAMIAVAIASLGIILYVTLRFELYMALAAIVALLHDAFFIIAFFSLTRLEVDVTFIAAILTIIGYSINDTIVTFDRIRHNMKKQRVKTFEQLEHIVNRSIQQTFTRSVNTVLTVVITVVAMLIFGNESIRNFSIALLIGLITGMYSSLYIASQLWLIWKWKQLEKQKNPVQRAAAQPNEDPQP